MDAWITLRIALRGLRRHAIQSTLAVIGIVVGVIALVAMASIGNGARERMREILSTYDPTQLEVAAMRGSASEIVDPAGGVTVADYQEIKRMPMISQASPFIIAPGKVVTAHGRETTLTIFGVGVDGIDLEMRLILRGAAFGEVDVKRASSVALLTKSSAEKLFPGREAVGGVVRIEDIPFIVIGIVSNNGRRDIYGNLPTEDPTIFVPYTTLQTRISPDLDLRVTLRVSDVLSIALARERIGDLLESRRGKRKAEFRVLNEVEGLNAYTQGDRTVTNLLTAVSGVSLLVGGIGIMNVMLVSVVQRTREVGIRLALGTKRLDLLKIFMLESIVLASIGGVSGAVLGTGVAQLISQTNGWPTRVTSGTWLLALVVSVAVGTGAGYYPAVRASRLDPVEALRAE